MLYRRRISLNGRLKTIEFDVSTMVEFTTLKSIVDFGYLTPAEWDVVCKTARNFWCTEAERCGALKLHKVKSVL